MARKSLRQRLGRWLLGKMTPEEWFASFGGDFAPSSSSGEAVTQRTAMQVAAVLACVAILSEDVAKLPRHVFRKGADGSKKIAADHPLERLLQKPNRWQDGFEFVEEMQGALVLESNAYAAIIGHNVLGGTPTELVPINPNLVQVYEAESGQIFYRVSRNTPLLRFALQSLPEMIPADSMFHLRWMSRNIVTGLRRIGISRDVIGLALAQQRQASRFSRNAANIGGVLKITEEISDEADARLREDFAQSFASPENAGKTPILPKGVDFNKQTMTSVEGEFMSSREFSVLDICRICRVPPHKVAVLIAGAAAANIVQQEQDYANSTVSSYLGRWESKLGDAFSLARDGLFVEFDIEAMLRADIQTRLTALRTGVVGMIYTVNEARAKEGRPPIKGGDVILQPTNMAPLGWVPTGKPGSGPGSDTTGQPAEGGSGDPAAVPALPE